MKIKSITSMLLTSGLLSLAGCAQSPKTPPITEIHEPSISAPVDSYAGHPSLLAFAHAFTDLSLRMQKNELATIEQNAASDHHAKLLLAVMYGHPTSRVRDSSKAQVLLDEILADKTVTEENLALAAIMRAYLNEISKSGLTIREEQKRAEATQKKLDELQKKLDDLKSIERTIVDREQGVKK